VTITDAGIFRDREHVERAIERLARDGFERDRMSVIASEETHGKHFSVVERSKAPEGIAAGGIAGGVAGAVLAALAAAAIIPGVGLIAVGPIAAALAGGGVGAAAGGIIGGLVGWGIPEHEAKLLADEVKKGGILLGVEVEDRQRSKIAAGNFGSAGAVRVTRH
jgi:uncharacterized membrane protein